MNLILQDIDILRSGSDKI